jgi:hypothetical protein
MTLRERFRRTFQYDRSVVPPCFEEGIRERVFEYWRRDDPSPDFSLLKNSGIDRKQEIEIDLEPKPRPERWPNCLDELPDFRRLLNPEAPERWPGNGDRGVRNERDPDTVRLLRVHRGFFLSMGVYDWRRFSEVMMLMMDAPEFVRRFMEIQGEFNAAMADRALSRIEVDAAIFSDPIGGNDRPLISPDQYEAFVLKSYVPLLEVLRRHGVNIIIFRTYANARILIPRLLKYGFNCLWACEVNVQAMDYRDIRREYGRDLRLIGGLDLDALGQGRAAVEREIMEKVPPLVTDGGYFPLADGRLRAGVPFEDYVHYRKILQKAVAGALNP